MTVTNLVAKWSAWGPQLQSLLRIESERHLASLERGEPMPTLAAPIPQEAIDAVALDKANHP